MEFLGGCYSDSSDLLVSKIRPTEAGAGVCSCRFVVAWMELLDIRGSIPINFTNADKMVDGIKSSEQPRAKANLIPALQLLK